MTKLFPESEDEEDNAVCADVASRDEVGRKVSRDELGREESVSPTPEAEELANSMFDFQSTLTTFVDSTVAHEEHLTSRLDKQLEMIWLLQQQVEDTIKKVEDLMTWRHNLSQSLENDWLKQQVEDSIKTDWLQEEVERLVWKNCEEAKEDIKDETRDFVAEETKNDNEDKFNEMFEKLDEQLRLMKNLQK
jgi:hypothetical protein